MIKKFLFALFTITTYLSNAQGVEKSMFVERIPDVITTVNAINKDKNGFLWIGRWDGLYRYDGKSFRPFNHITKTWTNFNVTSIQEDYSGNLWIAAFLHNPLIYNPAKDSSLVLQSVFPQIIIPDLYSAVEVTDSSSFIASSEKIYQINHKSKRISTIEVFNNYKNRIRVIKADNAGNLWVGFKNGMVKISPDLKQMYYPELFKPKEEITNILCDRDGSIWLRTTLNLIHFDDVRGKKKTFLIHKKNDVRFWDGISAMEQDGAGNIWLGIPSWGGLVRFNTTTETFESFPHKPGNIHTVNSNYIKKLFYSKDDDILWIGTQAGLNKIVFNKQNFNIMEMDFPDQQNYVIRSLYQDSDLNLWVKTNDEKIHLLSKEPVSSVNNKISLKKVVSLKPEFFLEEDERGDLFFVGAEGAYTFNKKTDKAKTLNEDSIPFFANPIKLLGKSKLLATDNGSVLIISIGDTLRIEKKIQFNKNADNVRVMVDQYGNILASRNEGLFILDSLKQEFSKVYDSQKEDHEADLGVYLKDSNGFIWLGTGGSGLIRYNPKSNESKNYGFADHTIGGILIDDNHKIWASTNKGLLMLNPETGIVTSFTSQDGIQLDQIGNKVFLKGRDGNFYFGGLNKILSFDPLKIKAHNFIPNVFITGIKVLNKPLSEISKKYNSIEQVSEFETHYNQNTLTFEFASVNFAYPDKTIYYYQMSDVDNDWVLSATQQITYSNLSPGVYHFRVKAFNAHSEGNSEVREVKISILPPFWKTWWAYATYIALLTLLSTFIWRRSVTRMNLKTLAAINSAEAETLREMDTLKSHFFANVSHEFRTPLTLLLGPIEKRLTASHDQGDKAELTSMHRNASRLLTLVNQLLDLSRIEAGTLKLKCVFTELHQAILSISSQFSSMADSKGISFKVIGKPQIMLYVDPDKLEKIVSNLLSNAFKFTPAGGTITLSITQHSSTKNFKNGYAEIAVTDTGTGIESEHLPKIFDRFFQVDMSSTRAYEGSGIGLSLTKELVELHQGTIEVKSEFQVGSTFTLRLPLGKDHLKPEEITTESYDDDLTIQESVTSHTEIQEESGADNQVHEESILIIEDNADLRVYIRNELQQSYTILESADGEQGITMAIREIPTLIISDLMMPKKDGLAVCHELKEDERTSHIPIILLTAKVDIDSKLQGYHQGADDYISKPFNVQELRVRIQNLIAIRKKLQAKFGTRHTILPSEISVDSADGRFLKKAVAFIELHLSDLNFGVEPLARELAVSQTQLYRKIQAVTGSGPNEFIRHIRLFRAADLLRNKAGNVSEVAYEAGFNNLSYFSKAFKEKFGITPNEFLKNPIAKS